jgi:uncharacterized protein
MRHAAIFEARAPISILASIRQEQGYDMTGLPDTVTAFLSGRRIAVAGVSRQPLQTANAIFRKLKAAGYDAIPVNPKTENVEGVRCFPDIASIPGSLDGVMIVTPPAAALDVVRQAAAKGVRHVWFHRGFGQGSFSPEAAEECRARGIAVIENGCPMMYCDPVDPGHKCIRWWLSLFGKTPG